MNEQSKIFLNRTVYDFSLDHSSTTNEVALNIHE